MNNPFDDFVKMILNGDNLSAQELHDIALNTEMETLSYGATLVRNKYVGKEIKLCAALNIKSGHCGEDCKYCSQSSFYNTNVEYFDLVDYGYVKEFADNSVKNGVHNLGLSSSGGALSDMDNIKLSEIYKKISQATPLNLCGAHGILHSVDEALRLKEAGLNTYEHNLQTSKSFYRSICTTHEYQERINTIRYAQEAGLGVCSGGIIGLGETIDDRIEMALQLRELGVRSMPINILNPVAGTPCENGPVQLTVEEVLRSVAIFRLALPEANLIYGAGRAFMGTEQSRPFAFGMSGIVVGNFLTTKGNSIDNDMELLYKQGVRPAPSLN